MDKSSDGAATKPKPIEFSDQEAKDAERLHAVLAAMERKITIQPSDAEFNADAGVDCQLQERALEFLALRRARESVFGRAMFGEPAWEILLLLYGLGCRQTVTRLAELSCASKSTAIRWIDYLEGQRLVVREEHPTDNRSVYVDLTDKAREAVGLYLFRTAAIAG